MRRGSCLRGGGGKRPKSKIASQSRPFPERIYKLDLAFEQSFSLQVSSNLEIPRRMIWGQKQHWDCLAKRAMLLS